MTAKMNGSEGDREASSEYVHMYYEHQYDRMAKLEDQRLIVTNVVITLTVVTFTLWTNLQDLTVLTGLGLPIVMTLINLFAIIYIIHSSNVIDTHQRRAKKVLKLYAKDLYQLDQLPELQWSHRYGPRWQIQVFIHIILAVISLLPIFMYLRSII